MLGLAQLLITVDTTIVTLALPAAQHALGFSDGSRQWVVTAYTLAFGGLLLVGGRLADRWGRKLTVVVGAIGFAAISAVAGASVDGGMLIASRAAQGMFAAVLAPSALSLLAVVFPSGAARTRAYAIFSAISVSGAGAGLLAGGALIQFADWRWCLYLSAPIAACAAVGAVVFLPKQQRHQSRLDMTSAILGCAAPVALVWGLSEFGQARPNIATAVVLLVVAGLLVAIFLIRQRRITDPLLPLSVVTERHRAAAFAAIASSSFGMFAMFLFLTYQLQTVFGWSALPAGVAFLPIIAANFLTATQLTRRLLPRLGQFWVLTGGFVFLVVGLGLLSGLSPTASYPALIAPAEVLLGMGSGLVFPAAMNIATREISGRVAGAVSAFVTTCQQLGASLGTAVLNSIAIAAAGAGASHTVAEVSHGYAVSSTIGALILIVAATAIAVASRTPTAASANQPGRHNRSAGNQGTKKQYPA